MILFFYGPNIFAGRRKVGELVDQYIKKNGNDFGIERINGETIDLKSLESALQAVPFLAGSRLVIIENLGVNKNVAKEALNLLDKIPDSTVALFFERAVDERTIYFKDLKKRAQTFKFELLAGSHLKKWVTDEARRLGGEIEPAAVDQLIERAGDDQWRLHQEILKLVNFQNVITVDAVRQMVEPGFQQTIFDLVDAMTNGKVGEALQLYRRLLAERTEEIYVLSMVTWQLRNLILAKAAGRISPGELAKSAGMSPYVAAKALSRQESINEAVLRQAFLAALQTNYAIKTGQGEPSLLVEQLINKIATGITA